MGIDGGAELLYGIAIGEGLEVVDARVFAASAIDDLLHWVEPASQIAIDSPATLSTAPHRNDLTLSAKFRTARCAEIQLGKELGIWVPWVTPTDASALAPWMRVGLELFTKLVDHGKLPIEVFPFAGFCTLAGAKRLPKKSTAAGAETRARLLERSGIRQRWLALWSHDALDALLAALIAHRKEAGVARPVSCGHDASAIWIPDPPGRQ